MAKRKQRKSASDRAFARGISRVRFDDDDSKPKPPLDPVPEYEPKKKDFEGRFEAIIDPAIQLSEEGAKRIEKQLRQAVLNEIAQLDVLPEVVVRTTNRRGSRGVEVRLVRQ